MKLSIITINYNNRDGLQRTIDSVIAQTYKDFEWIVIDGGSTDGSKELIEKYSDHITYWVSEPDKGIYNAMNKGIRVANGEYLQFLNSGDNLYKPSVLQQIFDDCELNHDIIIGNIFSGNKIVKGIGSNGHITLIDFFYNSVLHPATFIKKECMLSNGGYDENLKICSDWKFFVKAIVMNRASYIYKNITVTEFDDSGISSQDKNVPIIRDEKKAVLSDLVPPCILDNYQFLQNEFVIAKRPLLYRAYILIVKIAKYLEKNNH